MRYILGIVDPLSDRKHGLFVMSGAESGTGWIRKPTPLVWLRSTKNVNSLAERFHIEFGVVLHSTECIWVFPISCQRHARVLSSKT